MAKDKRFEKIQNILANEQFRYLYLGSLISADNLMENKENYEYSRNSLLYIKDNISSMDLTEDVKAEILKFVKDGLLIIETESNYYQ